MSDSIQLSLKRPKHSEIIKACFLELPIIQNILQGYFPNYSKTAKKKIFKLDSANTVHTYTGFRGQNIQINLKFNHKLGRARLIIIQYKCTNKVKSSQNLDFQASFKFRYFFPMNCGIHDNFSNSFKNVPSKNQSVHTVSQLQTRLPCGFQMLHIKMISSCFNVVAAVLALAVLVCVHSTALSVPRSCLW